MADQEFNYTPWINTSEWKEVYDGLYSEDSAAQDEALATYFVWKARSGTRLASGIETTVGLLKALKKHQSWNEFEEMDAALMYSAAIIRFVNLMVELKQNSFMNQSINTFSKKLGIDEFIVDVRHEATHANLPPISILKEATQLALQWLKNNYWEKELKNMTMTEFVQKKQKKKTEWFNKELIIDMYIQKYMRTRFENLDNNKFKNHGTDCEDNDKLLEEMKYHYNLSSTTFTSILCMDGYLTPSQEQLNTLTNRKKRAKTNYLLHPIVIDFWKPVILFLEKMNGLDILLEELIKNMTDEECLRNRQLTGWIEELLLGSNGQIFVTTPDFNGNLLYDIVVSSNCQAAIQFLPRIINYLSTPISEDQRNKFQVMMTFFQDSSDDDFHKKIESSCSDSPKTDSSKKWRREEATKYYNIPIGAKLGKLPLKLPNLSGFQEQVGNESDSDN